MCLKRLIKWSHDFSGLLSGHMKVRIHDEAYVRVHLGILSLNLDFLVARACFKGGTEYNIDILKVYYNYLRFKI